MNKYAQLLLISTLITGSVLGGDERFGFVTHFQQGWSTSILPAIAASGAGWIRDNYVGSDTYYSKAHKAGLKVCVVVGSQAQAITAATNKWADTIEFQNEPNNIKRYQGTAGEALYVSDFNATADAIKALPSAAGVIGPDYQGQTILSMLPLLHNTGTCYHPYSDGFVPERVYEPPFNQYTLWIAALYRTSRKGRWETEWGIGTSSGFTEANKADFLVRRMLLACGLGIEHTFIYEWQNNGTEPFGVSNTPSTLAAVSRVIAAMHGVGFSPPAHATISGGTDSVYSQVLQGNTKTVCSIWIGDHSPATPPAPEMVAATFSVPVSHPVTTVTALDALTGAVTPVTWSRAGSLVTVAGLAISDDPLIITVNSQ
jgi:hypothetical protein